MQKRKTTDNKDTSSPLLRGMLLIVALASVIGCRGALTAQQVMQKSAATLGGTVTVSYRISGQHSAAGLVVASGSKFFIDAGKSKVWYNGKVMTTLNLNTGEATMTNPTGQEVNETFPLSYIATWSRDYSIAFAKKQPAKGYCLVLTSKSTSAAAKKAVLTIDKANFQPRKLVISLKNGGTATVSVTSIRKGSTTALANSFQYPQKRYPRVKIVDLR